jgi:hypothetical protein
MTHHHFCDFAGHYWECEGKAVRPLAGGTEPSVCMCQTCKVPMEEDDHSQCPVELLTCPEHLEAQQRKMEDARLNFERQLAEAGLEAKWKRVETLPDGDERNALIDELLKWMFPGW